MFIPKKINKSQILKKKKKKRDQIRSRFDPEIGAGMLSRPLRWLRSDGGFGATVTVASVQAERSVREKARWLGVGWA